MHLQSLQDSIVLWLVRWWTLLRHPLISSRTFRRSRALPQTAVPRSDFDKFLWRKIFDHNPLFTMACDKLAAKEYAKSVCPDLKVARLLWTGTDPSKIPDRLVEGSVVVKANHGSRWNMMIRDGDVDIASLRRETTAWMQRTYGRSFGEWGYKHATRSLLIEEMLVEDGRPTQSEFKFHVAGGRTAYVFLERDEGEIGSEYKFYLDRDGRPCEASLSRPVDLRDFHLPACFARMRQIAEALAAPFDFVRCDLYAVGDEIYFSELTAYPVSGVGARTRDLKLTQLRNDLWDLRKSWFLSEPQRGWRSLYAAALRRRLDALAAPASGG